MFRKADRAKLEWIETEMVRNEREYQTRKKLNDVRWAGILNALALLNEQQDKLLQSHAALERQVANGHQDLQGGIIQVSQMIHRIDSKLEDIHVVACQPKQPKKSRNGKKRAA